MKDAHVTLKLPVAHAAAVASLLDLATRIHMGQVSEITSLMKDGRLPMREEIAPWHRRRASQDEIDRSQAIIAELASSLGHPEGSHLGIGGSSGEARLGYEAMKVLKKALHGHLTPNLRHVVDADGLTVRYAKGEAPEAAMTTDQAE